MKRLTVTLAALAIAAAQAALAQPPGPPPGGPGPSVDRLAQDLGLSDAQKGKVKQIFDELRAKREAARDADKAAGKTLTPDERRARGEASEQELLGKLGGVLTPAQLAKFKEIQAERRQRPPGTPPGPQ